MKRKWVGFAAGLFLVLNSWAGTVTPYHPMRPATTLPTNAPVHTQSPMPLSPAAPAAVNSPAPSVSFQGLGDDNTSAPPDTDGAVGPNHVVTMINTQVRIQNRAGTTNYSTTSLASWWSSAGSFSNVFDPRIVYDAFNNRWIAAALADNLPFASTSAVMLAVSQTSDPTGAWYFQKIAADPTHALWADFPSLGYNKDWIAISVNLYGVASPYDPSNARVFLFNKTNAFAGGTGYSVLDVNSLLRLTVVPAVTLDNTLTNLYLVQNLNGYYVNTNTGVATGYLAVYTINGPVNAPVWAGLSLAQGAPWANGPPNDADFAPQTNTTVKINTADARMANVVFRNGSLWCTHTIYLPYNNPSRSSVAWWQLAPNGSVIQAGRIDDAAGVNFFAFPSIAVNRFNDVLVGYSTFSANQYAGAGYSFRAGPDAPNSMRTRSVLKAGEGRYYKTFNAAENRWGDYSTSFTDPVNDSDFWTVQEYAGPPNGTGLTDGDGRFAVWWGKVQVTVPANDSFGAAFALSGALGSTNGSVFRATKEAGEPSHAGLGASSVWYKWTAPANGNVTFDTTGSTAELDTLLAVYTGTAVGSLTLVTNNDNIPGSTKSRVTFNATSGTTYRVAVDAINAQAGESYGVVLAWLQPQSPFFTAQPQGSGVIAGNPLSLSAIAIGVPTPTYQWRLNATNISGATSPTYTLASAQAANAGNYTLVANNSAGSATSLVATVTVYNSAAATLTKGLYTNNSVTIGVAGVPGYNYVVQASTAFTNWVSVKTNTSPFNYTNLITTNFPYRFFRVLY